LLENMASQSPVVKLLEVPSSLTGVNFLPRILKLFYTRDMENFIVTLPSKAHYRFQELSAECISLAVDCARFPYGTDTQPQLLKVEYYRN